MFHRRTMEMTRIRSNLHFTVSFKANDPKQPQTKVQMDSRGSLVFQPSPGLLSDVSLTFLAAKRRTAFHLAQRFIAHVRGKRSQSRSLAHSRGFCREFAAIDTMALRGSDTGTFFRDAAAVVVVMAVVIL